MSIKFQPLLRYIIQGKSIIQYVHLGLTQGGFGYDFVICGINQTKNAIFITFGYHNALLIMFAAISIWVALIRISEITFLISSVL